MVDEQAEGSRACAEMWTTQQVAWRSRRGLLELDLILLPFFEQCYQQLDQAAQARHQQLLQEKDPSLQRWLVYRDDIDQLQGDLWQATQTVWHFVDQHIAK